MLTNVPETLVKNFKKSFFMNYFVNDALEIDNFDI